MMPFQGGLAATPNAALMFSLTAAFLYAFMLKQTPSWRRTAAKTLAVSLLAFLAYDQNGPALLIAALFLSAAGDAFLAQDGEKAFLGGLSAFLLAHVAYVALFAMAGEGVSMFAGPWRMAAALAMTVFAAAMFFRLLPKLGHLLRAPVAVYVAAIHTMVLSALTLDRPWVIAGALLFTASDGILAARKFLLADASPHHARAGMAVWILYYGGQVAITLGVLR